MQQEKIAMDVMFVTPDMASAWLKTNVMNRRLNAGRVSQLSDAIKRGEWKLTGEAIKFSADGNLLDGQHRLSAIIKADKGVQTAVIRGIDCKSFDAMDLGKPRGAADTLYLKNIQNYAAVAAGIRLVLAFKHRNADGSPGFSSTFTPQQIERELAIRTNAAYWGTESNSQQLKRVLNPGVIVGLGVLFEEKHKPMANLFFEKLKTGEGLLKKDPILTLRDRLLINRLSSARLPQRDVVAMTIKAWNAARAGKSMTVARFMADEQFPEIS